MYIGHILAILQELAEELGAEISLDDVYMDHCEGGSINLFVLVKGDIYRLWIGDNSSVVRKKIKEGELKEVEEKIKTSKTVNDLLK